MADASLRNHHDHRLLDLSQIMSIDLSLKRLHRLLPHLPLQYTRPTIHIAGTNGKGSVSALVSSILLNTQHTESEPESDTPPLTIGSFNSPHLVHITDSIIINDRPISHSTYLSARQSVLLADEAQQTALTPFEILTLTALQVFEREGVDVAVVEVGMGGRMDATNVIPTECVLVSAVTAVDMDHQRFLGSTVYEIAREKCGIARRGRVVVVGPQSAANKEEVGRAVESVVETVGADLVGGIQVEKVVPDTSEGTGIWSLSSRDGRFDPPPGTPVKFTIPAISAEPIFATLPLHGTHQLDNFSTSLGVVQALLTHPASTRLCADRGLDLKSALTSDAVKKGVEGVQWRGRLSWHGYRSPSVGVVPVLVDGAHNPASSRTLRDYIEDVVGSRGSIISSTDAPSRSSFGLGTKRILHLTYILGLSHSPPKSPKETLEPLLAPYHEEVKMKIALVPFTPPSEMPWVRYVPLGDLEGVVKEVYVSSSSSSASASYASFASKTNSKLTPSPIPEIWTPSSILDPDQLEEGGRNPYLEEALEWAVGDRSASSLVHARDENGSVKSEGPEATEKEEREEDEKERDHLIVIAGSLYLVADFYRLLEAREGR